jgi:hypothetical protein
VSIDSELAMLSEAVYLETWAQVEAFIAPDWQLVAPLESDHSEAMLCRRGASAAALVFRGTEFSRGVLSDVLANFGSWALWEGPGSLHAGYAGYVRLLYKAARTAVKPLAGAPLYVTGHSLGGAAAHVYAARMGCETDGHQIDAVVTFGAPKVFNGESRGCITAPIRRHIIVGDFAPKWPLNPWLRHPADPIIHEPTKPGMSPIARHWIGAYRDVLDKPAQV